MLPVRICHPGPGSPTRETEDRTRFPNRRPADRRGKTSVIPVTPGEIAAMFWNGRGVAEIAPPTPKRRPSACSQPGWGGTEPRSRIGRETQEALVKSCQQIRATDTSLSSQERCSLRGCKRVDQIVAGLGAARSVTFPLPRESQ